MRSAGVSPQLHHDLTAASLSCTTFRHGCPESLASCECTHMAIIYVAFAGKFARLGLDLKISDLLNQKMKANLEVCSKQGSQLLCLNNIIALIRKSVELFANSRIGEYISVRLIGRYWVTLRSF